MMRYERRITKAYFDFACCKYAPLIQKIAFRIGVNDTQIEEFRNQGKIELLKCMICYRNIGSFMTFFYGRITNIFRHMRDAEQRMKRFRGMLPNSITAPNCDMDIYMTIQECLDCLDDRERSVIIGLYLEEKTMRDISTDNRIVLSTVCRIKAKAISKMRHKCLA